MDDSGRSQGAVGLDLARIRAQFPILETEVHGHPLTYLDNAATSLTPRGVVEAVRSYYEEQNANIHRGVHYLSERATASFEAVRDRMRVFLNARDRAEIVFTSGTTAAINCVARALGDGGLVAGDEVLISHMEHHSNIVPWQQLRDTRGIVLRVVPITDSGEIDMDAFRALLGPRTRLVSVVHVSNSLGTVNPVAAIIAAAHAAGALVLVDAAQSAACRALDVQALDCDFLVLSAHKLFGPTGVGILYGKAGVLERLPPFMGGGDMILNVTFEKTTYNTIPYKFEAGTANIAGVIGLGAALDFVEGVGMAALVAHEEDLRAYTTARLLEVPGVRVIGTAPDKAAIISFLVDAIHAHDIGTILDSRGVAVRSGHHCTQPVMQRFGVPATARASFSVYNTREEADRLIAGIHQVKELMA